MIALVLSIFLIIVIKDNYLLTFKKNLKKHYQCRSDIWEGQIKRPTTKQGPAQTHNYSITPLDLQFMGTLN